MIDLRSDTVTKPTEQMLQAMTAAPLGDDVYAEDPTVIELEQRVARLLGHEAGLFCVSGSMCNMLGVRLLVEPGQEVVCDVQAHIARAEMGAHAAVQGITMRTFPSNRGRVQPDEVSKIIAPSAGPYLVSTAAVAVENTHNFGGGAVQPFDELTAVGELCREHGHRLPPRRSPVVERPRRNRCAPRRLWAALRHGQRVLLQGSRGSGRFGSGNHR